MRTAFLTVVLVLLLAGATRADVFAVAPVVAPGHTDSDVALIDLSTDTRLALPAGLNASAREDHWTPRALAASGRVRDLGKPRIFRVR